MRKTGAAILVVCFALGFAVPATSHAATRMASSNSRVSEIHIADSDFPTASAVLVLTFNTPISAKSAHELAAQVAPQLTGERIVGSHLEGIAHGHAFADPLEASAGNPDVVSQQPDARIAGSAPVAVTPTVTPSADGPQGVYLNCNQSYSWVGSSGTYGVQRACGSTSAPWYWTMAATVQAQVVGGLVSEAGQSWTKNGVAQPQQAPHPGVPAAYTFHGTYSGVPSGSHIAYADTVTFPIKNGVGIVQYYGSFTLTDNTACSPGKPC